MDKRPRKEDGSLFISCKSCGVPPDRCKGFCIFQRMTAEAEKQKQEEKRRNVPSVWQKNPVGADEVWKEYAGRHGTA